MQDGHSSAAEQVSNVRVSILYREYIQVGQFKHGSTYELPWLLRRFRGAMTYILAGLYTRYKELTTRTLNNYTKLYFLCIRIEF